MSSTYVVRGNGSVEREYFAVFYITYLLNKIKDRLSTYFRTLLYTHTKFISLR